MMPISENKETMCGSASFIQVMVDIENVEVILRNL